MSIVGKYDFVIWLDEDWGGFDFRRYFIGCLAEQLPESKILAIERPVCPVVTPVKNPRKFVRWFLGQGNLRQEKKNLFLCRPFVLLHDHLAAKLPLVPRFNCTLLSRQVGQAVRHFGLRENHLITWIYDPYQSECLGLVGERFAIYEAQHEYTVLPDDQPFFRPKDEVIRREEWILQHVDLVFVNSERQVERKSQYHHNIYVFPEAVPASFILAAEQGAPVPEDIASLPRPIIGLVGFVTSRIDFALLRHLASRHPDWSLVWVGSTPEAGRKLSRSSAFLKLKALHNVHLLPARPLAELIPYLSAFDVCIVPYTIDPWSLTVYPTKMYLYLATGKPIVSVPIPGATEFREVIKIADNHITFEQAVVESLNERDENLRRRRMELARENSWERRAETIVKVLDLVLTKRAGVMA